MPSWWAPVRTGWWPRSSWPAPAWRSTCTRPPTSPAAVAARRSSRCRGSATTSARPCTHSCSPPPPSATSTSPRHGVRLLTPTVAFAHPLGGTRAVAVGHGVDDVARSLGADGPSYARLFTPLVRNLDKILPAFLGSMRAPPAHPVAAAAFALRGLPSAQHLARRFRTEEGRALVAGTAAHSMLPLTAPLSGVFPRLFTALAHRYGWPVVEGGSAVIVDALVAELSAVGGRIETGRLVKGLDELPPARAVVLDVTPRQLVTMAGDALPRRDQRALSRYRYGPGVCKVDWALRGPVPWRAESCRQAVTLHVGGTFEEIALSEADVNAGRHPERPYCLVTQPCVVDPARAPGDAHTLWAYCHVPERLVGGHDGQDRGADRAVRAGVPRPRSSPGPPSPRWTRRNTTRATSVATSMPVPPHSGRWSSARPCSGTRTAPRSRVSTSAPPRRRPAAASTACAVSGPHGPRWTIWVWHAGDLMAFAWYRLRSTMRSELSYFLIVILLVGGGRGCGHGIHRGRAEHGVLLRRLGGEFARPAALRLRRRHQPGHRSGLGLQPRSAPDAVPPALRGAGREHRGTEHGTVVRPGQAVGNFPDRRGQCGRTGLQRGPDQHLAGSDGRSPQGG